MLFLRFQIITCQGMGNSCEIGECLQPMDRESVRRRSLSDPAENMTVKNMIQIKKGRLVDEYQVNEQVGEGSYGSVFRVTHRLSKVVRAAKRIQKRKKSIQALEESLILKRLDHPNIVRIYDIYYEKKYIHIVMDYCQGGQLFARIVQEQTLTEAEAALYMKQLLSAIQHCHGHNIMHRDLKPENIMFLSKQEKSLKIIDFGVGTSFSERNSTLKVGSVYYMAPEVIKKQYNQKCDIWSLGVILYIMLTGRPPFIGPTDNDIYQLILKGQVPFTPQHWDRISPHAKDLVQKMLAYEPANRISAKEALGHRWIKEAQGQEGGKKLFVGNQFESIRSFCRMNQFQSAIVVFISHHFMQSDLVRELQARFKSLDLNGDGQISWEEFQRCYLDSMPPIPETELRALFSKLDKNHSGYIDYSEFISSAIDRTHLLGQNLVEKAFDMIDKNHNGSLSRQELMQAFGGCNYEVYRQILRDFDLNNDGEISKYEFKLAMKGLLKR